VGHGTLGVRPFRLLHPYPEGVARLGGLWARRGRDLVTEPAVYLVTVAAPDVSVRAVAVAVTVAEPLADSGLLPHEAVDPRAVTRRTRALRRARVDREPVLVTHSGGTVAVSAAARSPRPLLSLHRGEVTVTVDRVGEPEAHVVLADLARRTVLVADGHHRLAASAAHARTCPVASDADGDDCALVTALVVDSDDTPLSLAPIHRVLQRRGPGVLRADEVATALSGAPAPVAASGASGGGEPTRDGPGHRVLVVDRDGQRDVDCPPRPHDALPTTAHVVEHTLEQLPAAAVRRIAEAERVTAAAGRRGVVGVLMPPVSLVDVLDTVSAGLLMPVKATSFRPKLPAGVLVRPLTSHW
jgi:hypothetical protein